MADKKNGKKSTSQEVDDQKVATKKAAKKDSKKKDSAKKDSGKKAEKKTGKKDSKKKDSKKKDSAKKVGGKKADKKASGKKDSAKKAEKKSDKKASGKKASAKKVAEEARISLESSDVETVSTIFSPSPTPLIESKELSDRQVSPRSKKISSGVVLAVIVGAILIATFAIARNHDSLATLELTAPATTPSVTPTVSPSSSPSTAESPSISPSPVTTSSVSSTPTAAPTPSTSTTDLPPVGIVAYFNSTGATIVWRPDVKASGITAYKIEKSANGGAFKLIATVPATQRSLNVTEIDTNGWSSFKVSAVYSDGAVIAGKVFGIPSQYS